MSSDNNRGLRGKGNRIGARGIQLKLSNLEIKALARFLPCALEICSEHSPRIAAVRNECSGDYQRTVTAERPKSEGCEYPAWVVGRRSVCIRD